MTRLALLAVLVGACTPGADVLERDVAVLRAVAREAAGEGAAVVLTEPARIHSPVIDIEAALREIDAASVELDADLVAAYLARNRHALRLPPALAAAWPEARWITRTEHDEWFGRSRVHRARWRERHPDVSTILSVTRPGYAGGGRRALVVVQRRDVDPYRASGSAWVLEHGDDGWALVHEAPIEVR